MNRGFFTCLRVLELFLGLALVARGIISNYFIVSSIISVLLIILFLDSLYKIFKVLFKYEKIRTVMKKIITAVKLITFGMLLILAALYVMDGDVVMFIIQMFASITMGAFMIFTYWSDEIDEKNCTNEIK